MHGKRDHFVPQHYLRQFRFEETEQIAVATIEPFRAVGLGSIKRQCQEDYFYEQDAALNDILFQSETDLAPVLRRVAMSSSFDSKHRVALNWLAALLYTRTKSAVERAKLLPRRLAHEFIKHGIETGRLPEPTGGWKEDMMDFGGVPGSLMKAALIPCWMEMQTLDCKMLKAPEGAAFITSDNPVAVLNEFCAEAEPQRCYVGFSRSGFELFLPISPRSCLLFYDPKVYKVGERRHHRELAAGSICR
jgi:hypothetical protein